MLDCSEQPCCECFVRNSIRLRHECLDFRLVYDSFFWQSTCYAGMFFFPANFKSLLSLLLQWWAQINIGVSFVFFFWIIAPILYCAYCDLITHSDTDDTTQSLIRTTLPTSPFLPRRFSTILELLINPRKSSPMASLIKSSMRHILPYFYL